MGITIDDGKGKGNQAQVNSANRLLTSSQSFAGEEVASAEGDGFILHAECHIAAATSGGLLYFKNTSSTFEVIVTRIYIDAGNLTDSFIIRQIFDATIINGTDISTTGIVNKNRASGIILEGILTQSDGSSDMTLSGGDQYHSFPVESLKQYARDMKGTNILTPNKSIAWSWATVDGGNGVDGEIISISCNTYRRKINGE